METEQAVFYSCRSPHGAGRHLLHKVASFTSETFVGVDIERLRVRKMHLAMTGSRLRYEARAFSVTGTVYTLTLLAESEFHPQRTYRHSDSLSFMSAWPSQPSVSYYALATIVGGIKRSCCQSICQSVRLSHAPSSETARFRAMISIYTDRKPNAAS